MDESSQELKAEEQERLHFQKVANAFRLYKRHSLAAIGKRETYLNTLPMDHQKMLKKHGYQDCLDELKAAVDENNKIIGHILKDVDHMFENVAHESNSNETDKRLRPTQMDMDKVQSTLKQIVRDWSSAGAAEREKCHGLILAKLLSLYPEGERRDKKVLVPGAGLGRLAFDIAKLGFECQGNEFSLYMLFTSNFILNKCSAVNCFKVFPYIHGFSNNKTAQDQLMSATFPDVDPNELSEDAKFSMAAGDFLEVYNDPEYVSSRDCVITSFFLDCAHNIVEFIETIHRVLKTGGTWINMGPLLYHFSDIPGEQSIEPSLDMIRGIIVDMGFEFLAEEDGVECTYDQNPNNMLHYTYHCSFFTCRKL